MHDALKFPLQSRECLDKDNINLRAVSLGSNRFTLSLSQTCHVFSRSSQHPFGERMMFMFEEGHEQNRTRRVPVAPSSSVDLRFRSFSIKPRVHKKCSYVLLIKPSLSSQRGLRRSAFHFQLFLRVR